MNKCFGYYSSPLESAPTHDPFTTVPCPICGVAWTRENVRTISLMLPGDNRSFFYRTHRTCHEALTEQEQSEFEGALIGERDEALIVKEAEQWVWDEIYDND